MAIFQGDALAGRAAAIAICSEKRIFWRIQRSALPLHFPARMKQRLAGTLEREATD